MSKTVGTRGVLARESSEADELVRLLPVLVESSRSGVHVLDWIEFSARFFPGHRGRHDFEALVAYGRYRRGNGNTSAAHSAEHSSWDGEGGTTLSS
jgi:hypothetical protein